MIDPSVEEVPDLTINELSDEMDDPPTSNELHERIKLYHQASRELRSMASITAEFVEGEATFRDLYAELLELEEEAGGTLALDQVDQATW